MASKSSSSAPSSSSLRREAGRSSPRSVASPGRAGAGKGGGDDVPHHRQGDGNGGDGDGAMKRVTPPKRKPSGANKGSGKGGKAEQNPDMIVEERVVDELLLIMGVIGSTSVTTDPHTGASIETFVPVTDSLMWLQDMQRCLRRDHATYRPISIMLGRWRAMEQKLLPLVVACRYDSATVLTLAKILVILTKPMSDEARRAGALVIDVKSGKVGEGVIREQIALRENAIAQSDMLMECKRLFVRHPSHNYAFQGGGEKDNGNKKKKADTGLLSVFTSLLAEPLSKTGSSRTSSDHLAIELVLHLVRNLLSIVPVNTFGSAEKSQRATQLHREFLIVLGEEMVLDVLVVLGQEVERRENQGYNLLLMEILSCLLRGQDPSDVALAAVGPPPAALSAPVAIVPDPKKKSSKRPARRVVRAAATRAAGAPGGPSLKAHLQSERSKLQLSASSRHSHFGGTLMIAKPGGGQGYVSAAGYLARRAAGAGASAAGGGGGLGGGVARPARRKNKKVEVFLGSGRSSALHSRPGAAATLSREVAGPTSRRAKLTLDSFCRKFAKDCYGPVMKSLKNEFRRESSRLEDGDRTTFFGIVRFFHQWWRVRRENAPEEEKKRARAPDEAGDDTDGPGKGGDNEPSGSTQNLIFTMDVFMFNLVLNSTDEFFEHRKPAALARTVALYAEMIHTLRTMYDSDDSTERTMALGLMDRLFYAAEPLDRLPRLLSRWSPGTHSREYLCDLVECAHMTLRLLDDNGERCLQAVSANESKRPKDAVERMNLTASEFDRDHYFTRRFVSNQIVFMYTQLLSQYAVNAAHINRHTVAYFIRLCKFAITTGDGGADLQFDDALGKNELAAKEASFEPILYNVGLFAVLDKVLNDTNIRDKPEFEALLMFASSFMKRFARAAETNPMLYVEALFKHPVPHRFCELSTNLYVTEELRMIAVRDLLLEDQRRYEAQHADEAADEEEGGEAGKGTGGEKASGYDDDEEEELEFNDDDVGVETNSTARIKKRRRKSRKIRRKQEEAAAMEEGQGISEEEKEAELDENEGDVEYTSEQDVANEHRGSNLGEYNLGTQDASAISSPLAGASADDAPAASPALSGKKRIRKSLEAAAGKDEDSDEEDFLGPAVPVKTTKRVIFDDDDED